MVIIQRQVKKTTSGKFVANTDAWQDCSNAMTPSEAAAEIKHRTKMYELPEGYYRTREATAGDIAEPAGRPPAFPDATPTTKEEPAATTTKKPKAKKEKAQS